MALRAVVGYGGVEVAGWRKNLHQKWMTGDLFKCGKSKVSRATYIPHPQGQKNSPLCSEPRGQCRPSVRLEQQRANIYSIHQKPGRVP